MKTAVKIQKLIAQKKRIENRLISLNARLQKIDEDLSQFAELREELNKLFEPDTKVEEQQPVEETKAAEKKSGKKNK